MQKKLLSTEKSDKNDKSDKNENNTNSKITTTESDNQLKTTTNNIKISSIKNNYSKNYINSKTVEGSTVSNTGTGAKKVERSSSAVSNNKKKESSIKDNNKETNNHNFNTPISTKNLIIVKITNESTKSKFTFLIIDLY